MPDREQNRKARSRKAERQSNSPTREVGRGSTNDSRPLFSFYYLVEKYNIDACSPDDKVALLGLLHDLSQRTWGQIQLGSRQGTGTEKISRDSINVGLPDCITPDVQLLAMRITDVARLIGFRDGETFHAVWIDPNHEVYNP